MKVSFVKQPGGTLIPANDMESDRLTRFKTGEMYEVDLKLTRNPAFHGKVFAFFNFCFNYWASDKGYMTESGQFDAFRKDLTVLAGYFDQYYNIHGDVRVEAKSLSYANMDPETFEQCYKALITAAMQNIFKGADDSIYDQLVGFF